MKFVGIILLLFASMVMAKPIKVSQNSYPTIKYKAGKEYLAEQLSRSEQKDRFGRHFFANPQEFRKILALVDPELAAQGKWHSMGIQPWPNHPGNYIFIACDHQTNQDEQFFCPDPAQGKTIIALLKYNAKKEFILAAKPWINDGEALAGDRDDKNKAFLLRDGNSDEIIGRGRPAGFDFTRYRLSAKVSAFGLKYIVTHNHRPTKTIDEGVMLFAVINGHLRPLMNVPTYHLAFDTETGDDGTIHLNHVYEENFYPLIVQSNFYEGMHIVDWIDQRKKGFWATRYVWDGINRYRIYISYGSD